jgi:hypothetical protein
MAVKLILLTHYQQAMLWYLTAHANLRLRGVSYSQQHLLGAAPEGR